MMLSAMADDFYIQESQEYAYGVSRMIGSIGVLKLPITIHAGCRSEKLTPTLYNAFDYFDDIDYSTNPFTDCKRVIGILPDTMNYYCFVCICPDTEDQYVYILTFDKNYHLLDKKNITTHSDWDVVSYVVSNENYVSIDSSLNILYHFNFVTYYADVDDDTILDSLAHNAPVEDLNIVHFENRGKIANNGYILYDIKNEIDMSNMH